MSKTYVKVEKVNDSTYTFSFDLNLDGIDVQWVKWVTELATGVINDAGTAVVDMLNEENN